jgi:type II secretory pathway pseudopilin PulG
MRRSAFTVPEMLAIVAIIAIILSLLLPAIGKARRHAEEVGCGSNMHQVTIIFAAYTQDNLRYYPDFSLNPSSGAQWTQPHYWTQQYWRDYMRDKYGFTRDLFYSPTNPRWNRDDFYWYDTANPNTSHAFVMGHFYFGSTLATTSSFKTALKVTPPNKAATVYPRRRGVASDYDLIWADINRQLSSHYGTWLTPGDPKRWGSNHCYDDPRNMPRGSHRAFTDGHIEWIQGDSLVLQMEYSSVRMWW